MVFNIGTQNAGIVNNVGRDQHVTGGQQGNLVVTPQDTGGAPGLALGGDLGVNGQRHDCRG